ncbi:hypothetical protein G7Y89_g3838 [Cudoniella acicularis]|uniref:Uncharacterized protein n=1 Tax=Cudoniella acicularis TaxID=354080 RepID=A0A8H4RSM3_9HELO|nr:hypothetical protein G7Y89_g3838 [Cudoniella acicularis]
MSESEPSSDVVGNNRDPLEQQTQHSPESEAENEFPNLRVSFHEPSYGKALGPQEQTWSSEDAISLKKLQILVYPQHAKRNPRIGSLTRNDILTSLKSSKRECIRDLQPNSIAHRKTTVLGKKMVFSPSGDSYDGNERLHLVTYWVGDGYLIPWDGGQEQNLHPGEVFCHWIAKSDLPEDFPLNEMRLFDGTETLLIGAAQVRLNPDCRCSNSEIKKCLNESKSIRPLAAYDPSNMSRQKQWKYRLAFLESWEHPEMNYLDPAELEHRYGLEISLSTCNARKVPLVRLLGSQSILQYLRPFPWSDTGCKTEYINAVRDKDLRAFRQLWQDPPPWQEDIRKAVCCCLRALSETGVGIKEEVDALYVLWVPAPGQRHLVTLNEQRDKWSGFLRDSRDYFTMAVVTGRCLDFTDDNGRGCGSNGYSIFETALIVNDSIKPIQLRKVRARKGGGAQELDLHEGILNENGEQILKLP